MLDGSEEIHPLPEFGDRVLHRAEPCTPRELFSGLFTDPEQSVHYVEPAFHFVAAALRAGEPLVPNADGGLPALDESVRVARAALAEPLPAAWGAGWLARLATEFAPTGLSDGAWLQGSVLANAVETEIGMRSLRQLMIRFGDPGSGEAYSQRYAGLLRSLGISIESVTHSSGGQAASCTDLAYEHALLGLGLGLFPSAFGPETLGFNLWMTTVGPCPLLERLSDSLRAAGACVRYFELYARPSLASLARLGVEQALAEAPDVGGVSQRVARGFAAAHRSYVRWERALRLAAEPREVAAPGAAEAEALALTGEYRAPQDPASLFAFAVQRYGQLPARELYYCFANSDCHPAIRCFGKALVTSVLGRLSHVLDNDARLNSQSPPPYSERGLAELVGEQHQKNVRSRKSRAPADNEEAPKMAIQAIFDGCWLQGFADVQRADFEEYGWLFRIYASEHGDGDLVWNHSRIARLGEPERAPDLLLPKTEPRLYELFDIGLPSVATLAVALNTRHFMPEILGMNLGIEATGVGGGYMETWKAVEGKGSKWKALNYRLHNSIDNYADGHTKWSQAAVHSFLARVRETSPGEVEALWHRIWRLWRWQDIMEHGTEAERGALAEHFDLRTLAPT